MKSQGEFFKGLEVDLSDRFLGKVVDRNSPLKDYSLKIKIYPFFVDVPDADLPWVPAGNMDVKNIRELPKVGEWVWCSFKKDYESPFWISKRVFNKKSEVGENTGKVNEALSKAKLGALSYPDYDYIVRDDIVVVISSGEFAVVDVKNGTYISKDKTGKITIESKEIDIKSPDGKFDINPKELSVKVDSGKIVTEAGGSKVTQDASDGSIKLESKTGNITVDAKAGKIILKGTDSALWQPNIRTVCPFDNLPHNGVQSITGQG